MIDPDKAERLIAKFEEDYLAFTDLAPLVEMTFADDKERQAYTVAYRKLRGKYLASRRDLIKALGAATRHST